MQLLLGEKVTREFILLYSCYVFSSISDQLWSFAMIFVLQRLGGIQLVCLNQLLEAMSAILFSGYIGSWMGRNDRLYATRVVLAVNNVSIALSALFLIICMSVKLNWLYTTCLIASLVAAALSRCASEGEKMLFTKDWIVVLATREDRNTLSSRNAMLTIIGHFASIITSIFATFFIVYFGHLIATCIFVVFNLSSWLFERYLLTKLYNEVVELHGRKGDTQADTNQTGDRKTSNSELKTSGACCSWLPRTARVYWKQSTLPVALCLVLAFMTVLGFDGIPISYGKANGLPDDLLGLFKGTSSLIAIIGAFSYTLLERRIGVRKTGLIGTTIHQVLNVVCVISIYLPGTIFDFDAYVSDFNFQKWQQGFLSTFAVGSLNNVQINSTKLTDSTELMAGMDFRNLTVNGRPAHSILVFFISITLARLGVWLMDLSIMQLMQENIVETERLAVFGIQHSLCQFFGVLKDVIVIAISDPRIFGLLIWMSVLFVFSGYIHYLYYFFKTKVPSSSLGKQHELEELKSTEPTE